jgi:hypothetical protein
MVQYIVKKPIVMAKGLIVELSNDQALPRLHNLKPLKGQKYEVKKDVEFKAGEMIGFELGKTKEFLDALEPYEVRTARK